MEREERIAKALAAGIKTQEEFEEVLDRIAKIRLEKVQQYGEARYEEPDERINILMLYSDAYRKHIRLRQLTLTAIDRQVQDRSALYDLGELYTDLANYALMGVQITRRLIREAEGKG